VPGWKLLFEHWLSLACAIRTQSIHAASVLSGGHNDVCAVLGHHIYSTTSRLDHEKKEFADKKAGGPRFERIERKNV